MLQLRTITLDEFKRWMSTESRAHGNCLVHYPEQLRPSFDLEWSIAVFEDEQIIGGCHSPLLEMSTPDGASVVADVADVEMQPTHARRGIMTQMMRHKIDGIHERGRTPSRPVRHRGEASTGVPATASARCMSSGASNRGTTLTPTAHSETSHRKVRNTVHLGPPERLFVPLV